MPRCINDAKKLLADAAKSFTLLGDFPSTFKSDILLHEDIGGPTHLTYQTVAFVEADGK